MNSKALVFTHILTLILLLTMLFSMVSCDALNDFFTGKDSGGGDETPDNGGEAPDSGDETPDNGEETPDGGDGAPDNGEETPDGGDEITEITIAEAMKICEGISEPTTERYYIRAIVKSIVNPTYGEMYIEDKTGEMYVYGTYSADGSLSFPDIENRPLKGDEVLLHCTLNNYNGSFEIKNARLIEVISNQGKQDVSTYEDMTIAEARDAEVGSLVKVRGVVAAITYASGLKPAGVILVDNTSSIYVYNVDLAGQVAMGNTIEIAASKAYWVLSSEATNAEKFGYNGSNQLEDAILISNDKQVSDFDKSWITERTVKDIMDTPVSEDITSKIFKVNALVKKVEGTGFTNYYFNDIDSYTGSYTYTQCDGGDFGWLDKFDGKICTVYLTAINAKSTASECFFRFLPIEVKDEGYQFDVAKAGEYAVIYHGLGQFVDRYNADPELELITSVSSELLGFEDAELSYTSSDESVIYFTESDGTLVMHCGANGSATVTVTGTYGDAVYSHDIEISVLDPDKYDYISVGEAIDSDIDTTVTVRGYVGPSVVNKDGFYLFDNEGKVIAVLVNDTKQFQGLEIGHEVILTGMRERYVNYDTASHAGQSCIVNAEIVANLYGSHDYSTDKFVTDISVEEFYNLDEKVDYSTTVYVLEVRLEYYKDNYSSGYRLYSTDSDRYISVYCSGAGQYSKLFDPFVGETVTIEIAPCNWNNKSYWRGCVLAIRTEDGKVYNTLNFDIN